MGLGYSRRIHYIAVEIVDTLIYFYVMFIRKPTYVFRFVKLCGLWLRRFFNEWDVSICLEVCLLYKPIPFYSELMNTRIQCEITSIYRFFLLFLSNLCLIIYNFSLLIPVYTDFLLTPTVSGNNSNDRSIAGGLDTYFNLK